MAEFLEDLDFYVEKNERVSHNMSFNMSLQMVDLAEKEGFQDLEIADTKLTDGILYKRLERLDKVKRFKIFNTNITSLANCPPNIQELIIRKGNIHIANFKLISEAIMKIAIINNKINKIINLENLSFLVYIDLSQNDLTEIPPDSGPQEDDGIDPGSVAVS